MPVGCEKGREIAQMAIFGGAVFPYFLRTFAAAGYRQAAGREQYQQKVRTAVCYPPLFKKSQTFERFFGESESEKGGLDACAAKKCKNKRQIPNF